MEGGQNYDTWLHGAGRKIFHSWSQRAASSGMVPSQPQPGAPAYMAGVSNPSRDGHVPIGAWSAGVVGHGGAATHQAAYAGGQPRASGSGVPQSVQHMSVSDKLAQLTLLLQNTELREFMGNNNVFAKK